MDQRYPSQHKLKRQALWAALWLAKLIRYMPDVLRLPPRVLAYVERRLDLLAGFVIHLIVLRAAQHCRPGLRQRNRFAVGRAAARRDVRVRITHDLRATIGGRLRRELCVRGRGSKNLKARAQAILRALQNLDRLVARFVRRMKNGLSRRMSVHTRALNVSPLHRPAGGLPAQIAFGEASRAAVAPP